MPAVPRNLAVVMALLSKLNLPIVAALAPAAALMSGAGMLVLLTTAYWHVHRNTVPLLAQQAEVVLAALQAQADPELPPEALSRSVDRVALRAGGVGFVLDAEDRLMAHPRIAGGVVRAETPARLHDAIIAAFLDPEQVLEDFSAGPMQGRLVAVRGDHYGVVLRPLARRPDWRLGVYLLRPSGLEQLAPVDRLLLLLLAVMLALALLTWALARRLLRPLRPIVAAAEGLAGPDPTRVAPLEVRGVRELRRTASALNRLREVARIYDGMLPRQLARRLSAAPRLLTATPRRVTALATGLDGFADVLAARGEAEAVDLLRRHLTLIAGRVAATDGLLAELAGDGVLALWNAFGDQPDHARRALQTARAIAALVATKEGEEAPLRLCCGIATGEATVGDLGPAARVSFSALGPVTGRARRLERACRELPPATVRCLADAATLAAGGFDAEPAAGIADDAMIPRL